MAVKTGSAERRLLDTDEYIEDVDIHGKTIHREYVLTMDRLSELYSRDFSS